MQSALGYFNSTGPTPIGGMLGSDKQFSDYNLVIDPSILPSQNIRMVFGGRLTGTGSISFALRQGGTWKGANGGGALSDGSILIATSPIFTAPGGIGLIEWNIDPFDIGSALTRIYITYTVGGNTLGIQDPFLISFGVTV